MVRSVLIALLFLLASSQFYAQKTEGTAVLDQLLKEAKFKAAQIELQLQIDHYRKEGDFSSLSGYPYYVGKIALENSNKENAIDQILEFNARFKKETSNAYYLQDLHTETASFYQSLGLHEEESKHHKMALDYALKTPGKPGARLGTGHYNLGTGNLRRGLIAEAIDHYRKALKYYLSDPKTDVEDLYFAYSSMGTSMYYSSKIDSAIHYYEKAADYVAKAGDSPLNRYYRPALLLNNIAGLYSLQGETTKSLEAMKTSIAYNGRFLQSDAEDFKKTEAKKSRSQYIDNLAGIYEKLGDYQRALQLLEFSYAQKLKTGDPDSPELFKSKILVGNAHLNLLEYDKAIDYLTAGQEAIGNTPGTFYDWSASAHYGLARAHEARLETNQAARFYERAAEQFTLSSAAYYDPIVLTFFQDASQFYAKNGEPSKALATARRAYEYVIEHQGEFTLPAFQQTVNMAKIHLELGNFESALKHSEAALAKFQQTHFERTNAIDSLQVEFHKPAAILVNTKARYYMATQRSPKFLNSLLLEIDQAMAVLARRTSVISSAESIRALIDENNELYNFAKELNIALYEGTNEEKYIENVLSLHETALYNRIRSRLGANTEVATREVPLEIRKKESILRESLNRTFIQGNISGLRTAEGNWRKFLDQLKEKYPKYYSMRYAPLSENLSVKVPKKSTVVRYLYVQDKLYALVLNTERKKIVELPAKLLPELVATATQPHFSERTLAPTLRDLYNILWKPIENDITTERVVIVPDGNLYNLSFEILTPSLITSFSELATNSLLAKHTLSYAFSSLLIDQPSETVNFRGDFVAFAPEFSETMKQKYREGTTDSLALDASYLTLLPQPFSVALVKKYAESFNGIFYTSESANKAQFNSRAGSHKIIHLGTHAESNNISPSLSRLIFAKDISAANREDNFLYTHEIYNQDLTSQLAILTACETGKPTYQPGEGMISLAHAFTYAGSQSILTSLWKIDEQSSAKIMGLFYDNLADGIPKDRALQLAKQSYLATAKGRTRAPIYWGGLVIMGNTEAIQFDRRTSLWVWAVPLLLLLGIAFFYRSRFRK